MRQYGQGLVDVFGLLVHIAGSQTEVDAALLAFNVQRAGTGQRGGQRLCPAHATQTSRQNPAASPVLVVMLATGFHKGLEGTLHDALGADVNPRARSHLPVHEQALAVEFVEVLPIGPLGHEVGVGNQHAWCVSVRLEHAHWFA